MARGEKPDLSKRFLTFNELEGSFEQADELLDEGKLAEALDLVTKTALEAEARRTNFEAKADKAAQLRERALAYVQDERVLKLGGLLANQARIPVESRT